MYNKNLVGGNRFFLTYVEMRTALLSEMPADRVCWREFKMQEKSLFWRRAGLVVALASLPILAWVGGIPVETPAVSSDDIVIQLAVAKEGDILQFSDGRRCRVVADRDTTEIHYVCAGDFQTILTTKIGDLSTRVTEVSPPKNRVETFVSQAIWQHAATEAPFVISR